MAAAAAPRTDGLVRLSSLGHPADSCDVPLTLSGPPPATPAWAARPYALLRALARAGYGRGGTDLHVQGSLTPAAGLDTAEAADCAVALAVADVHTRAGEEPDRAHLARLMARALPDGDDALRRGCSTPGPAGPSCWTGDRAHGSPGAGGTSASIRPPQGPGWCCSPYAPAPRARTTRRTGRRIWCGPWRAPAGPEP